MRFDFWLTFHWFSLLSRKSGSFKPYQWISKPFWESLHTLTRITWVKQAILIIMFTGKFFAYPMLVYRLYVCVILICSLADFSELDTCVWYSTCEGTNLVAFLSLFSKMFSCLTGSLVFRTVVGYFITLFTLVLLWHLGGVIVAWHFLLLCFTLCLFVTKRGSNFLFGPRLYF
jgi:hypothetical protein